MRGKTSVMFILSDKQARLYRRHGYVNLNKETGSLQTAEQNDIRHNYVKVKIVNAK